jgi:hypothetical protein
MTAKRAVLNFHEQRDPCFADGLHPQAESEPLPANGHPHNHSPKQLKQTQTILDTRSVHLQTMGWQHFPRLT